MNGNITEQGIRQDLEWMHRVGIGGVQTFDASIATPQLTDRRLVFMTPPWQAAFRHATDLANALGLELAIAGSPGFSESGGPWVRPEQGMKKLVWREVTVQGGVPVTGKLPQPPSVVGPFQDVPVDRSDASFGGPPPVAPIPALYRDVALIAYRLPEAERSMAELRPTVNTSSGSIDAGLLWDGELSRALHLPYGDGGKPAWIQIDFGTPRTIQSLTLGLQGHGIQGPAYIGAELEESADGQAFQPVAHVYDSADDTAGDPPPLQETVTFAPITARFFRVRFPTPPPDRSAWAGFIGSRSTEHLVTELVLHPTPRVDQFEKKAGYFLDAGVVNHPTRTVAARDVIDPKDIIDLTARLRADGTLDWTPPPGRWVVSRLGYSLLGITNHPASPEGTGLEVDKLSRDAVKAHMDEYLHRYESMLGSRLIGAHGLRAMVNDSYEAGPQNWTEELPAEFARRREYDMHLWLPALTGRIIESAEATDRFLWDFRRTLGELMAENHYGQIAASLHARGLIHYCESHEGGREIIADGMEAKRNADLPMGAMWMPGLPLRTQETGDADLRESASVAHIYGQNRVASESMTAFGLPDAAYVFTPESLKPTADRELADGVNVFVIHTSVHQPLNDAGPGITLGPFGQWFTRHETWADEARPWVTYLARSSYLLQQGRFVADILYYYGQDSNITALFGDRLPPIPEGYAFDFASPDALSKLSVKDGGLVTESGMRYRLLALDPRAQVMSLDVLQRIAHLAEAGATVVGEKPIQTPSLADDPGAFSTLTTALWGDGSPGTHSYGAGRVLSGTSIAEAVAEMHIAPDFTYVKPASDSNVVFLHRRLDDGDLFFINNRQASSQEIEANFRVSGKAPELWHADTGRIEPASYRLMNGRTLVPLRLEPSEAVFVVFRTSTSETSRSVPKLERETLSTLAGPWEVRFPVGEGTRRSVQLTHLSSWTEDTDPAIRYFSGTATYRRHLPIDPFWLKNERLELDLGAVKDLAEVRVNGTSFGVLWKPPFRVDVTGALHAGSNSLEIRVTNTWVNRLIGDKQPGSKPHAHATFDPYKAESPLQPAGVLGPVELLRVRALQ
jgi:hypothetical protein